MQSPREILNQLTKVDFLASKDGRIEVLKYTPDLYVLMVDGEQLMPATGLATIINYIIYEFDFL